MSREEEIMLLESRLARYSGEDSETGLRNLRQFLSDCSREFSRSQRTLETLRLIVLKPVFDLDLADFAKRLRRLLTSEALLARIGASSFAVLIAEEKFGETLQAVENISDETPLYLADRSLSADDIGVATPQRILQETLVALEKRKVDGLFLQGS